MADKKSDTNLEIAGISFPKDAKAAGQMVLDKTQNMNRPPYWMPKRWAIGLPGSIRSYPEIAILVADDATLRQGFVMLRYHDSTQVSISLDKLYKGVMMQPGEITQKWVQSSRGEKDIRGRTVE